MNVIQKSNAMGAQSMTSLEIAQVTGKKHDIAGDCSGDWQDAQGCDESHPKHGASLVEG